MSQPKAYLMGVIAAVALIGLTVSNLDYQGVYYDELHQAPASFRYLGKNPVMFTLVFNDILLLNTSYGGAIKSHIYGVYLLLHRQFTVFSWRLLGILFVAAGLFLFYATAGRFISWPGGLIFAGLLLTDTTVLLTTRYDWGPTALALGIRLLLVAIWLSLEFGEDTLLKRFASGLLVGVAIWEKLIAIGLLGALLLMLSAGRRMNKATATATLAGLIVGTFPVAYANYSYYRHGLGLISMAQVDPWPPYRMDELPGYARDFLALGHGAGAGSVVLGDYFHPFWPEAEVALIAATLLLVTVLAVARWRKAEARQMVAGKMVAAYAVVAIVLYVSPNRTNIHHWIQGTPFQYAAICLGLAKFSRRSIAQWALLILTVALLLIRLPNVAPMEAAIAQGKASSAFTPVLTQLGKAAASRSKDAVFIAADWGSGTQIYCLGGGDDGFVYEPFYYSDPAESVRTILKQTKRNTVYIVVTGFAPQFAAAVKSAIETVARSPEWTETPVEAEFSKLAPFTVRKFERRR